MDANLDYSRALPSNEMLNMDEKAEYASISVSYTHLDVYKRQGFGFALNSGRMAGEHAAASILSGK